MARPMVHRTLRLTLLAGALATSTPSAADEVQRASDAVHGTTHPGAGPPGRASSSSSGESSTSASSGDSGDGDAGGTGWGVIAGYVLLAPFVIPHFVVEEGVAGRWSIEPRPYAGAAPGYLSRVGAPESDTDATYYVPPERRRRFGAQVSVDGMPPLGGPGRVQLGARLVTAYRVELDAAYGYYVDRGVPGADAAWIGKAHASFRFAQGEHVQFRAGAGYRQWIDATGSTLGFDGLYAFDIYWGWPMTTSIEGSGGTLGSAWAAEARGTVGATVGIGEVFLGYDALWIGSATAPGSPAYLGGPIAGLRAYF